MGLFFREDAKVMVSFILESSFLKKSSVASQIMLQTLISDHPDALIVHASC
jgi:hypothetical protein